MPDQRFQLLYRLALLGGLALGVGSCQTGAPISPATGGTAAPAAAATTQTAAASAGLAGVLQHAVTPGGWVVVDNLQERAAALDAYLQRLETHGPTATPAEFPAAADRLAYWLNARLACSLKVGLLAGCPPRLTAEQLARAFALDGRTMRLSDIDAALAAEGGWRGPVAAPGVTMDRAAPPRRPFAAGSVEAALQERVEAFIHDDGRFTIDVDARQVRVPPVLWGMRGALMERYARAYGTAASSFWAALQDALGGSGRRRMQDAVGYKVMEAPASCETCFRKWHELLP